MKNEAYRNRVKRRVDVILSYITYVMAFSMLIYSVCGIVYNTGDRGYLLNLIIFIVPICCAALILLDRHKSLFFAIGLYAISIGFSRAIRFLPMLASDFIFEYVGGLVLVILALNMIYSGYRFLCGNARSIIYLILGATAFSVLLTVEIAMNLDYSEDTIEFLKSNGNNISLLAMYLVYIALAWSEQIRESTNVARMNRAFTQYRLTVGSGPDNSVSEEVCRDIMGFWKGSLEEGKKTGLHEGPVYEEFIFSFKDGLSEGYGILRRLGGPDGPVYLSFVDHIDGSIMHPNTMGIADIQSTDAYLLITFMDRKSGIFRIRSDDEDDGPMRSSRKALITEGSE